MERKIGPAYLGACQMITWRDKVLLDRCMFGTWKQLIKITGGAETG
jgi:hypothetical protein